MGLPINFTSYVVPNDVPTGKRSFFWRLPVSCRRDVPKHTAAPSPVLCGRPLSQTMNRRFFLKKPTCFFSHMMSHQLVDSYDFTVCQFFPLRDHLNLRQRRQKENDLKKGSMLGKPFMYVGQVTSNPFFLTVLYPTFQTGVSKTWGHRDTPSCGNGGGEHESFLAMRFGCHCPRNPLRGGSQLFTTKLMSGWWFQTFFYFP